jgi:hypothetical protein
VAFLREVAMVGTLFVVVCALAIALLGCAVVDPTKQVSNVPPSRARALKKTMPKRKVES